MEYLFLGFFTGLSLILAIGAQNIFVIEQGLKKQHVLLVCLICSISDLFLIFFGIFLFNYFSYIFTSQVEIILNFLLLLFLINFIYSKIKQPSTIVKLELLKNNLNLKTVTLKTLGFTYLNPHVYSDTIFFLGNFSKNFLLLDKYIFGLGASISSFLFFFVIGYLSKFFSKYLNKKEIWRVINAFIISFMSVIIVFVLFDIVKLIVN